MTKTRLVEEAREDIIESRIIVREEVFSVLLFHLMLLSQNPHPHTPHQTPPATKITYLIQSPHTPHRSP